MLLIDDNPKAVKVNMFAYTYKRNKWGESSLKVNNRQKGPGE